MGNCLGDFRDICIEWCTVHEVPFSFCTIDRLEARIKELEERIGHYEDAAAERRFYDR